MRIISLIPSATEIVSALGFQRDLVGRSHECDWPAGIERLPVLTEPKMNPRLSTREIDRDVRTLVEQGLSVYRIDTRKLDELKPDIVITQDQCDVCAVSLNDVTRAVKDLANRDVKVVSLKPLALRDVFEDFLRVADALGAPDAGRKLNRELQLRLLETEEAGETLPRRPRVVHIEWIEPLMVGGHWIHELTELAGGEHRLGVRGGNTGPVPWEQVRDYEPEVIVIAPCGFTIPQSEKERHILEALPGWRDTPAAKNGRVFFADGNAYFNRPGPRLVETAEIIQSLIAGRLAHHGFPADAVKPFGDA